MADTERNNILRQLETGRYYAPVTFANKIGMAVQSAMSFAKRMEKSGIIRIGLFTIRKTKHTPQG